MTQAFNLSQLANNLNTSGQLDATDGLVNAVPVANGGTGSSTSSGARTNLGLGTISTQNSNSVSITGGSITGITDLAVADGGTGASTAANARTNLDVPSTNGTGATGTWGIGISGNAATATNASTVTTITTTQVLNATAAATVGAIGTYATCRTAGEVFPGGTIAGSSLEYAGVNSNGVVVSGSPSGTWRCMGYTSNSRLTLYLRIS